jgi:hypothetical protein
MLIEKVCGSLNRKARALWKCSKWVQILLKDSGWEVKKKKKKTLEQPSLPNNRKKSIQVHVTVQEGQR